MTRLALLLITLLVLLSACSDNQEPTPAPLAAAPTNTPLPTAIPIPTNMPEPTATPTLAPTDTPTLEPTTTPTATETPLPTDTPTPTPTPEPVAVVTGDLLNVRSGPGTVYPVVGQAAKDDRFSPLARNQDGAWIEILFTDEQRAWVSAALVSLSVPIESLNVETEVPPTPVPTPTTAAAPQSPSGPPTVSQGPNGSVVGRVLGRDGNPRAGEMVKLYIITLGGNRELVTYTGDDGRFAFSDVPTGQGYQFMLYAGHPGRVQIVRVNGQLVFKLEPGQLLDVANVNLPY